METTQLIEEVANLDGSQTGHPRRTALKQLLSFGKKASLAALPVALTAAFEKAAAQTTTGSGEADALNLLLAVEYAQYLFYNNGLTATTIIPTTAQPAITTLRDQSKAHIDFLTARISALGGTPRTPFVYADLDYRVIATRNATTGAPLTWQFGSASPTTDYKLYIGVAMLLEDFGYRVYKGQLLSLLNNKELLTAIAQFHSLEGRHSAAVRQLVADAVITNPANLQYLRPWVSYRRDANGFTGGTATPPAYTANDSGVGGLSSYYEYDTSTSLLNREIKTVQAGIETIGIGGFTEITLPYAAESFDEYILAPFAKTLFNNFVVLPANYLK